MPRSTCPSWSRATRGIFSVPRQSVPPCDSTLSHPGLSNVDAAVCILPRPRGVDRSPRPEIYLVHARALNACTGMLLTPALVPPFPAPFHPHGTKHAIKNVEPLPEVLPAVARLVGSHPEPANTQRLHHVHSPGPLGSDSEGEGTSTNSSRVRRAP